MASKQEKRLGQPEAEKITATPVESEEALTPEQVHQAGQDLVAEVKTSGQARLDVAAKGVSPEDQDQVAVARSELKQLDVEADEALEILDAEIIDEGDELPPPIPPEAMTERKARKTQEISSIPNVESKVDMERKQAEEKLKLSLATLVEQVQPKEIPEELQASDVKISLYELMAQLYDFSAKFVGYGERDEAALATLNQTLQKIVSIRPGTETFVSEAFEEVFQEFGDFFDQNLVQEYIEKESAAGRSVSVEHATQAIYKRTPEEVERIKERNRTAAVELMNELAQKGRFDITDVEALHAANNKGIVPKAASRIRAHSGSRVTFAKRIGTFPEQLEPALQAVLDRANELMQKQERGEIGKLGYGIEAAKLHNDFLDIHPFRDRNGSTAMLFLETLMARQGYEAEPAREKKYYAQLQKILGSNWIAMGVVFYEQVIIAHQYGYHVSAEIAADPRIKELYDERIASYRTEYAEAITRYKKELAVYKKAHDKAQPGKIKRLLKKVGSIFRKQNNK